jgi:phage-related protein (TIGR01555 family)
MLSWINDKLQSLVEGFSWGTGKTSSIGHVFVPLTQPELIAAYRGDWLSRKVVDVPAFDMVREGRAWQAADDQIEKLEAGEERVGLQQKIGAALKRARLYGGAVIVIGVDDGQDPSQPLALDRVQGGGLKYLAVLNRYEVTPGQIIRDVASPYFGEPEVYTLHGGQVGASFVRIHPSRVVRFIGAEVPDQLLTGEVWGDSVLQAVGDALTNATLSADGIANLITEAKLDVYKIKGFMNNVSNAEYRSRMLTRFRLANTSKSMNNALLLDAEEEYEQKQINFANLDDVARLMLQIASGAADIPATRLLGQAPAGLNATGDSDVRNYYDRIASDQEISLRPAYKRIDEVLIRSELGNRPPEIHFTFNPLWQLSETERSENRKRDAESDKIYAETSLVPADALATAVQNKLVEAGTYPGLEAALAKDEAVTRGLSNETVKTMLAAKQGGVMRLEDIFAQLSAGGWVAPGVTFEKWRDDLEIEGSVDDPNEDGDIDPITGEPLPPKPDAKAIADAAPRTLYVSRPVLNVAEIAAWAIGQGIEDLADDLHVTIAYSRVSLDWIKAGNATEWGEADGKLTIPAGGPRLVEPLGNMGAVLLFASSTLCWRHEEIMRAGASHDWSEYQPHISLTKTAIEVSKVEPYRGKIVLGPERFEEVDPAR